MKILTIALMVLFASVSCSAQECSGVLELVNITEKPPDTRIFCNVWVQLTCSSGTPPNPIDWQLAETSSGEGNIFVYLDNPTIACIRGEVGTYEATAVTVSGSAMLPVTITDP